MPRPGQLRSAMLQPVTPAIRLAGWYSVLSWLVFQVVIAHSSGSGGVESLLPPAPPVIIRLPPARMASAAVTMLKTTDADAVVKDATAVLSELEGLLGAVATHGDDDDDDDDDDDPMPEPAAGSRASTDTSDGGELPGARSGYTESPRRSRTAAVLAGDSQPAGELPPGYRGPQPTGPRGHGTKREAAVPGAASRSSRSAGGRASTGRAGRRQQHALAEQQQGEKAFKHYDPNTMDATGARCAPLPTPPLPPALLHGILFPLRSHLSPQSHLFAHLFVARPNRC
eukprot:COSAG05_NODE_405_length_10177_cov_2.310776_13_plen_284_part_00